MACRLFDDWDWVVSLSITSIKFSIVIFCTKQVLLNIHFCLLCFFAMFLLLCSPYFNADCLFISQLDMVWITVVSCIYLDSWVCINFVNPIPITGSDTPITQCIKRMNVSIRGSDFFLLKIDNFFLGPFPKVNWIYLWHRIILDSQLGHLLPKRL